MRAGAYWTFICSMANIWSASWHWSAFLNVQHSGKCRLSFTILWCYSVFRDFCQFLKCQSLFSMYNNEKFPWVFHIISSLQRTYWLCSPLNRLYSNWDEPQEKRNLEPSQNFHLLFTTRGMNAIADFLHLLKSSLKILLFLLYDICTHGPGIISW